MPTTPPIQPNSAGPPDTGTEHCPSRNELAQLLNDAANGALRDALEAHLGECDRCQQVIQDLAVAKTEWEAWDERIRGDGVSWPDATVHAPDASDPQNWPDVPGYQIQELIGRGGMGVVFRARHIGLDRKVALKTLPLAGANQNMLRRRLQREAEALARIHHPHVVQIFEILDCDGAMVLVLEYIRGGSLADRLRKSIMTPAEAARLIELVARTMQDAHDADILHRDLKPANILLTVDGIPKVTDFGLARRGEDPGETKTGQIIGTPSYLAPEQAQGLQGWSTPAVDVYGLGAILYESLTGRPPFRAATSFETLRQVVHEEPMSPSRLQQRLPRDLVTICLKCLRKDPSRRYASCLELAEDLQRFQTGKPIRARRISTTLRAAKWVRRHPLVAGLTIAFVIAVGLLLGLWGKHTNDLSRLNEELQAETDRAMRERDAADRARQLVETERRATVAKLTNVVGMVHQRGQVRPSVIDRQPVLELPLKNYARILSHLTDPRSRWEQARGYNWLGQAYMQAGDIDLAEQYLHNACHLRISFEREYQRDPDLCLDLAVYYTDWAETLYSQFLREHRKRLRIAAGVGPLLRVRMPNAAMKQLDRAVETLEKARAIVENSRSSSLNPRFYRNELHAHILFYLARARHAQRRRDEVPGLLQAALELLDGISKSKRSPRWSLLRNAIESRLRRSSQPKKD